MPVKVANTKAEFDSMLAEAGGNLVVVDFTATWCGPCQRMGPLFHELSGHPEYASVVFIQVDVDSNSETAGALGVQAMPTFKYFKNSQQVDELVGASLDQLKAKLNSNK